MRIRKKKWIDDELESSQIYIKKEDLKKVLEEKIKKYSFRKIEMEIGCGKGGFISNLAPLHDDILYIVIETSFTMLGMANRNIRKKYEEMGKEANNIILINLNAENLKKEIGECFEFLKISRIYLNFSNPWPKAKHKKRRLTHPRQLLQYLEILDKNAEIFIRTDDQDFFEDSLIYVLNVHKFSYRYKKSFDEYVNNNKEYLLDKVKKQLNKLENNNLLEDIILPELYIYKITNDLKKENIFENFVENIETEHEKEFSKKGKNIYAAIINRRK